jgi:nicotinate-nucleotide pyrophosphorylase (carboxylating)
MNLLHDESVSRLIALARQEDLGDGDVTTALMADAKAVAKFTLVAKQKCVLAGREVVDKILAAYDRDIQMLWSSWAKDGARVDAIPATLATLQGPLASVLAAERILLNFLQRLCGVATLTNMFVDVVAGTCAGIYDTRKTTPGWRTLEKYAVRCGGGKNHRHGLFDAVLIKDNHLAGVQTERLAGAVFEMLSSIATIGKAPSFIEVEAADLAQMRELCIVVGIDVILLDNFSVSQLAEAVQYRDSIGLRGKVALEASGGVTLQTVRAVADTGVERISVGALTHSASAIDMSLERL